jgi:hypothetical protein
MIYSNFRGGSNTEVTRNVNFSKNLDEYMTYALVVKTLRCQKEENGLFYLHEGGKKR